MKHTPSPSGPRRSLHVGHRGAAGHAPENTLAAIRKGIALGVDYVEVDIQRTRDGRLVVMHDLLVDRTTDGSGLLADLTWQQLQLLDAGEGERIPALEAVLAEADAHAGVMLEAKMPGLAADLVRAVQASGFSGPVLYASFLHAELLAIRGLNPQAQTMALIDDAPPSGAIFARDAEATHAGLSIECATPELVATLRKAGHSVYVYTLNEREQIERAIAFGVDGLISDYPDRLPRCP
ncbi:MAG TPA: glycerophosphodiester phosphodiesterase family protein [Acidobacteriaceae bacterium]|jgi:glycerophosphoryl diester phosphodiesterase